MSQQSRKKLNIGLFGFGVVGEGLYQVLREKQSFSAGISKVCIKHPDKKRNAPAELFTTEAAALLDDPEINVIVELINDADAAFEIVKTALQRKKAVVSANKKMIAEHLPELLRLQQEYETPLLYEAACCASIPVIRNLEEYYDNDLLQGLSGIVNGSTNYILTKVFEEKRNYEEALLQAQVEGFAETDPSLDVEGIDAVNKLTLLLAHAYGIVAHPQTLVHNGITNLHDYDAIYAREKGFQIRLVAQAQKLENGTVAAFVLPQFVGPQHQFSNVRNEYNGVVIRSGLADTQFFYGKGAGSFPTASAVLSDLSALRYDYQYEYKKLYHTTPPSLAGDFLLHVYVSFEGLFHVPHELFEKIDEWTSNDKRCAVVGWVRFSQLRQNNWWKRRNTSLILYPDAVHELGPDHTKASEQTYDLAGASERDIFF